jgi:hypothetical protein
VGPSGESVPGGLLCFQREVKGAAPVFQRTGLQVVGDDSLEVYAGTIKIGPLHYFKAMYADRADSKACAECHNGHLLSSRRDYKLNDVMGVPSSHSR